MMNTFKEMTDPSFTKSQLKNKYDGIKKNWRVWKKLVVKTDVGLKNEIETIDANNEQGILKTQVSFKNFILLTFNCYYQ
jgi:hypothetical protein